METSTLLAILAVIASSSVLTAIVSSWLNRQKTEAERRKTIAEANGTIANTAIEVVRHTIDPLNKRIDELVGQVEDREIALEDANGVVLRLQLAFVINEAQIEALNKEPLIKLDNLMYIPIQELRQISREIKEK